MENQFFGLGIKFNFVCVQNYDRKYFNPTALRKAKIYAILAFLSAIGLNVSLDAGCNIHATI